MTYDVKKQALRYLTRLIRSREHEYAALKEKSAELSAELDEVEARRRELTSISKSIGRRLKSLANDCYWLRQTRYDVRDKWLPGVLCQKKPVFTHL